MKKTNVKVLGVILSVFALSSAASDSSNWGNPYDLWVGGAWYQGSGGVGHTGTHGSVVSGASYGICNSRLQEAMSSHSGESTSITGCNLRTTVLFLPQVSLPVFDGDDSNTGNPIWNELKALEAEYNFKSYKQEIQNLENIYNIEGFRTKYEALHQRSIIDSNNENNRGK
jgi:hypothetical protein